MPRQVVIEGVHYANRRRRIPALAFRPDGGASYTALVPGGAGYTFVRLLGPGGSSLAIARDLIGLVDPDDADAWIYVEPDADQTWCITQRRYAGS